MRSSEKAVPGSLWQSQTTQEGRLRPSNSRHVSGTVQERAAATEAAAARVAARVLDELDAVVERLGPRYLEVPEYRALDDVVLHTAVLPVSGRIIATFLEAVAAGEQPSVDDVADVARDMGRRRLEMGVPLEPMLHVYRIAGRVVWEAIVDAARPGEEPGVAYLGGRWMEYMDEAASVAASAYLEASYDRLRRVDARRGALLQAVLAAQDEAEVAAVATQFSTAFAPAYVPVAVAADHATSRVDAAVASCPADTIWGFRGAHVLLLVPQRTPDLERLRRLAHAPAVATGALVAPGPALAVEVASTQALLEVAVATGAEGVFGPDDLLAERLLAGAPRVASVLEARIVAPLRAADRNGLLRETLAAYLATGSVRDTASTVVVHPNTVLYRLGRVAELTGCDPRVPAQAALLVLALAL